MTISRPLMSSCLSRSYLHSRRQALRPANIHNGCLIDNTAIGFRLRCADVISIIKMASLTPRSRLNFERGAFERDLHIALHKIRHGTDQSRLEPAVSPKISEAIRFVSIAAGTPQYMATSNR